MRVVYSPTARRQIRSQLAYLIAQGAIAAATRARRRVLGHIRTFLAVYPKTGKFIEEKGVYEAWIPHTRYVVFYRVTGDTLRILALFHTSQDRSGFDPREDEGEE